MKEMWDERFGSSEYFYGTEPNALFKQFIDTHQPGKILLPAEGEGRNAIYAAQKGWDVTAIDFSQEAHKKAILLAEKCNVKIQYLIGDIKSLKLEYNSFDYCACVFMHLPQNDLNKIYEQLSLYLRNNGKLLIIGFNKKQLNLSSGGPKDIDWLFSSTIIKDQFKAHKIITCKDFKSKINEGKGHEGVAELTLAEIELTKTT